MKRGLWAAAWLTAGYWMMVGGAGAVTIDWAVVQEAGNAADSHGSGYGRVSYAYRIGRYEVTNSQYCEFLNAVAATDTHGLYNSNMGTLCNNGGILRSGASGSYTYTLIEGRGSWPVNFVSYYHALRFSNWLHHGQPTGPQDATTTEDGAYDLTQGANAARKAGAQVFVPSEDEWYKAAYYRGAGGGYWDYATRSNVAPNSCATPATDNNSANYWGTGHVGAPTHVCAYWLAVSAYGTFDQSGNMAEWTEGFIGMDRCARGGAWNGPAGDLAAASRAGVNPANETSSIGFRVAAVAAAEASGNTADINGDGKVNLSDLAILAVNWLWER